MLPRIKLRIGNGRILTVGAALDLVQGIDSIGHVTCTGACLSIGDQNISVTEKRYIDLRLGTGCVRSPVLEKQAGVLAICGGRESIVRYVKPAAEVSLVPVLDDRIVKL